MILDKEVSSEVGNVGKHKPSKSVARNSGVKNALVSVSSEILF
jgi:hypothetical protein